MFGQNQRLEDVLGKLTLSISEKLLCPLRGKVYNTLSQVFIKMVVVRKLLRIIYHMEKLFSMEKNYVFEFSVTRIPQGNQQRNREGRTEVSKLSCHKMTKLSLAITFFNAVENRSQRLSRSFNKK